MVSTHKLSCFGFGIWVSFATLGLTFGRSTMHMFISFQYFSRDHHEINLVYRACACKRAHSYSQIKAFYAL